MPTTVKSSTSTRLKAFLVCGKELTADDRSVRQLLDFFGIPGEIVTVEQLTSSGGFPERDAWESCCVLSSAGVLAEALGLVDGGQGPAPWLTQKIASIHVYGFQDTKVCKRLLRCLTNDANANVFRLGPSPAVLSVAAGFPEICGPMSGLNVSVAASGAGQAFAVREGVNNFQPIVSTQGGTIFARVEWKGVPVYLNASPGTIDIDAPALEFFDVRKSFSSAVPIVMYLKWAFAGVAWKHPETSACLIVDDPLLMPRYGFLRFRRALELMDQHNFTMSLAFIPWNWRRTDPDILRLFQDRADRFSVSVHGCDHTAREFAARSSAELNARAKIAGRRMNSLEQRTSLPHDRIMVFPQGQFSAEVGRVLKLNGYLAAVNTEVSPTGGLDNRTRIADLWDVANNRYASFPIFTRRYPTHGIENFAFDMLLGKPCFLVTHHDEFKNNAHAIVELVDKLNALPTKPVWRSLGEAVRRSFRTCVQSDGKSISQLYGNDATLENPSTEPWTTQIVKEESDPEFVRAVTVNEEAVKWTCEGSYLRFAVTIPPKATARISVQYDDNLGEGEYPAALKYRVKTGLRRYLSEVRDQYVSQSEFLRSSAVTVRRLLK